MPFVRCESPIHIFISLLLGDGEKARTCGISTFLQARYSNQSVSITSFPWPRQRRIHPAHQNPSPQKPSMPHRQISPLRQDTRPVISPHPEPLLDRPEPCFSTQPEDGSQRVGEWRGINCKGETGWPLLTTGTFLLREAAAGISAFYMGAGSNRYGQKDMYLWRNKVSLDLVNQG